MTGENKNWIDMFGNEIRPGSFIVYGVSRASLTYAVVKEYTKNDKIRVCYPHANDEYIPPAQYERYGRWVFKNWKTSTSVLSLACSIAVFPFEFVKTISSHERKEELMVEWQKLYIELNNGSN